MAARWGLHWEQLPVEGEAATSLPRGFLPLKLSTVEAAMTPDIARLLSLPALEVEYSAAVLGPSGESVNVSLQALDRILKVQWAAMHLFLTLDPPPASFAPATPLLVAVPSLSLPSLLHRLLSALPPRRDPVLLLSSMPLVCVAVSDSVGCGPMRREGEEGKAVASSNPQDIHRPTLPRALQAQTCRVDAQIRPSSMLGCSSKVGEVVQVTMSLFNHQSVPMSLQANIQCFRALRFDPATFSQHQQVLVPLPPVGTDYAEVDCMAVGTMDCLTFKLPPEGSTRHSFGVCFLSPGLYEIGASQLGLPGGGSAFPVLERKLFVMVGN